MERRSGSLMEKVNQARQTDPSFARAHRTVQKMMAAWAVVIGADRAIGLARNLYSREQLPFALIGGLVLLAAAFLGTRGHLQGAMLVLQLNMAVFLVQFASSCFFFPGSVPLWAALFYGCSAGVLIACSLIFFLNRPVEAYRTRLWQLKHGDAQAPSQKGGAPFRLGPR